MLIHIVPGASMGGLQRYSLDICRHYAREGQEVVALTRDAKAVDRCFDSGWCTHRCATIPIFSHR